MFGSPSSSTPAFGTPSSTPAFGTPSTTPAFGTPSSSPAFGSSLLSTPFSCLTQQQRPSLFSQTPPTGFGLQTPFAASPQQQIATPLTSWQLTSQMAPVAPLPFSLADRDIQAIVDAYKVDPGNTKYAFKHLLFSVTNPQYRVKPGGVSYIMWAEAMGKLEGMESTDRERLWPQLVQGFKDLSNRLKLQDEVILSDTERLRMTQSNVKLLQRHLQADTLLRIQRMRQKELGLDRRLLRVMRITEAVESKGFRLPLVKGEVELAEKLTAVTRQLKGSGAELSRRVQNLLAVTQAQANGISGAGMHLPGSTKIHDQSLADLKEVLQKQTDAISRLSNLLKRDIRDMEIIMAEASDIAKKGI